MTKFTTTRLTLWALLLVMPLLFSSCKKDNDDVTPATVDGNWKITGLKYNPAVDTGFFGKIDDFYKFLIDLGGGDCLNQLVLTFNSNGTTSVNNPPACQNGTDSLESSIPLDDSSKWALNGNKLTITASDGTATILDVTIKGNTMTLSTVREIENFSGTKTTTTETMTLTRA